MKTKYLFNIVILLALIALVIPGKVQALAIPPVDMFQLPWEQGLSWIAMDGFDNGTRREKSSPHNYNMGGSVDFAPHVGMKIGEDTSNAWVTAVAAGRVTETSVCHIKINHGNGWTTEYYHLGNIQVKVGNTVSQNQRLAIIDNNEKERVCIGNRWPGPHLHFVLRPNMRDAALAGWVINYNPALNITTFTKNGQTVGLFQPMLNSMGGTASPTPTPVSTGATTPTPTPIVTTPTPTFVPTDISSPTPTPISTDIASSTPTFVPTDIFSPTPTAISTDAMSATPTAVSTYISPTPGFVTPTDMTPTYMPTDIESATATSTPISTAIPGLHVVTVANPAAILAGETSYISVYLNNVPLDGITSAEFTCSYDSSLLEISNIADGGLFGADAVMALNGPQSGKFIFAVAGSNGRRVAASGIALTFSLKGTQIGESYVVCTARISKGDNLLIDIPHVPANLFIYGSMTTPTPTASLPPQFAPVVMGQVFASKPVTIRLFAADNSLVNSIPANADGTFNFTFVPGTYTITASAEGFLGAQGTVTLANNFVTSMSTVSLPAGDIDGNNIIDQYDAMTIGMSYNTAFPSAADLNSDGGINVLDLELLAANYRKSGALMWQ